MIDPTRRPLLTPLRRCVAASALLTVMHAPLAAELVLATDAKVQGKSQTEWSRLWWQWALSFERDESPVADRTGDRCHLKQDHGSVWFLAGTYGTRRTVRTCTVPRDKYLFFPLINYVVMPPAERNVSCEAATASARQMTDGPQALVLDIDGRRVEKLETHRLATVDCFNVLAQRQAAPSAYPSASNGYYVMLKPLSPGRHELNFGGILPEMAQAVTYTLIVE